MMKVVLLIKSNLSAEEAFRNLLWLSDLDAIFLEASRVYNLHLIAIVSLNSQGDPKEFLPFLQELELMSPPILLYIEIARCTYSVIYIYIYIYIFFFFWQAAHV
jgi:hypothetical protein